MPTPGTHVYPLTRAAEVLGISFRRLRRQMQALNIQPSTAPDDQRTLLLTDAQVRAIAQHLRQRQTGAELTREPMSNTTSYLLKLVEELREQVLAQSETIATLAQQIERMSNR